MIQITKPCGKKNFTPPIKKLVLLPTSMIYSPKLTKAKDNGYKQAIHNPVYLYLSIKIIKTLLMLLLVKPTSVDNVIYSL